MKKCAYCNCGKLFPTNEVEDSEAVKDGNRYYHKKCLRYKKQIPEARDLFINKVNRNAPFSTLVRVINTIVFDKNNDPEELIFGINYFVDNRMSLNYPAGLYYVMQNQGMHNEYVKNKAKQIAKKEKEEGFAIDETVVSFNTSYKKKKSIVDIIG